MPFKPFETQTFKPLPEAEQGFFDKAFESAKRGQEEYKASVAVYESLTNPEVDQEGALNYWRQVRSKQILDPIEDNWATNIIYANARTAGQMWETVKVGGKAGAIAAGAGAGIGAFVGAIIPTVGEEGITTTEGAIIGFKALGKLGLAAGSAIASYREGVGSMYAEMIQQGVDPDISRKVAQIAGIPYAILEVEQLRILAPNLKQSIKNIIEKKAVSLLAMAAKKYGKTLGKETLQEVGQEIIQFGAEDIAKYLNGKGITIDKDYLKERISRVLTVAKESAKAFSLLPVPGTAIETGINWAAPDIKAEVNNTIKEKYGETKNSQADFTQEEGVFISKEFPKGLQVSKLNDVSLEMISDVSTNLIKQTGKTGQPLSFYAFRASRINLETGEYLPHDFGWYGAGTYYSPSYTETRMYEFFEPTSLYKVTFENPFVVDVPSQIYSMVEEVSGPEYSVYNTGQIVNPETSIEISNILRQQGYDGIIIKNPYKTEFPEIVVFDPDKSIVTPSKITNLVPETTLSTLKSQAEFITDNQLVQNIKTGQESEAGFFNYEFAITQDILDTKGPLIEAQTDFEITPEDVQHPLSKISIALQKSIKNFIRQESIRKKERGQRFSAMKEAAKEAPTGEDWKIEAKRELAGEYTKLNIDPLQETVPIENYIKLHEELRNTKKIPLIEAIKLDDALEALFREGKIFRPHEIKYARKVWGNNFADSLEEISEVSKRKKSDWTDYLSLPKATSASLDLSRTARQNILMIGNTKQWFKALIRDWHLLLKNEATARLVEKDYLMKLDKAGDLLNRSGIRWNKWGPGVDFKSGTEKFASRFAGKIPGIRRSERAYAMGGNALRAEKVLEIAEQRAGEITTNKQWKDIGHVLNLLTGEGDPKTFGKLAPVFNAIFFAPRLAESRVRAFTDLFNPNLSWAARKILAYHVASFVSVNAGLLALASTVPGVNVETDPRSTDFGKIRYGDTRIDFWGGYLPLARLGIRLINGEIKTQSGRIIPAETRDTISSFLQSKLGPVPAFLLDLYRGQTFYGDYVGIEAENLAQQFYNRFTPFVIQDIVDAVRYQGLAMGAIGGALAFHGVGVQTYPVSKGTEVLMQKDSIASQVMGSKWDELGPEIQNYLRHIFPQIDQLERQAYFDSNNFRFLEKMARESNKVQTKFLKAMPKDIQTELNSLNLKPSGINRTISSDWFLNDKRYKQYEISTIMTYKKVLPKLIRSDWWKNVPPEIKVELLNYTMNQIKSTIRENIIAQANIKDFQRLQR